MYRLGLSQFLHDYVVAGVPIILALGWNWTCKVNALVQSLSSLHRKCAFRAVASYLKRESPGKKATKSNKIIS